MCFIPLYYNLSLSVFLPSWRINVFNTTNRKFTPICRSELPYVL